MQTNNQKEKLIVTADGSHSIYSDVFKSCYHSVNGAIQESQHIFINGGLNFYVEKTGKKNIRILEFGFGTGLNALLSYLFALQKGLSIEYYALEAYPLSTDLAVQLNYGVSLKVPWEIIRTLHQKEESVSIHESFKLIKWFKRFEDYKPSHSFDVIFFDAFGPEEQAHLWERPFLDIMPELLSNDGIFITYSVKGSFKRAMKSLGFSLEKIPGPPGKREILRATKG